MNTHDLLSFLGGCSAGRNGIDEICRRTGMGRTVVGELVEELSASGLVSAGEGHFVMGQGGKVGLARLLVNGGASLSEVCRRLDWRDFEELARFALEECGYLCRSNVRLRRPTRQIDVVGWQGDFAVAFDCKHWNCASPSRLREAALKQRSRCVQMMEQHAQPGREVLPALLLLHPAPSESAEGIPLVHSDGVFDFLRQIRGQKHRFAAVSNGPQFL
ncbi:MAG: hypothetical protein JRN39_04965 [Nitrososphaerota archaeon]|nr:hypothetical protein [Nitrososphaerota archaeon]MDG6939735.1 hypothetical protein [Nitrososphaerota archaeon]